MVVYYCEGGNGDFLMTIAQLTPGTPAVFLTFEGCKCIAIRLPLPAFVMVAKFVNAFLNWMYPPFRRLMPLQTFKYAACGGGNTLLSIVLFFVCYNFVFQKQLVHTPLVTLKPHVAAMITAFLCTFPIGFYLARNVVFTGSALRGRHQLVRYFGSAMASVGLNYLNLLVMVDMLHIYPTVAQIINTGIVIAFSYLVQKYFAFSTKPRRATA
ncbi:MAG TPA: GtrA family protein [Phnomibacter sp.]|nr:GtrA family protein [Phnomibacter sp.]